METKTFKERVAACWNCFEQKERTLRDLMDRKETSETLLNAFEEILHVAFKEIYFNVGISHEGKYELILTPEGDSMQYYATWYWLQQVPESLKTKWTFYASKPAQQDFSITMHGVNLDVADLTIYVQKEEERNKVNLEIYAPKLDVLENNQKYSIFFNFLDVYISELYTMNYIGYIDFVDNEKEGEVVPLKDLKTYIEKFMEEKGLSVTDSPQQGFSVYQLKIDEPKQLREDVFIGSSANLKVINNYYREDDEQVEEAEKNGIVWGFVYYDNSEVPQEEMTGFRGEIEDLYSEIMEREQMGCHIGGATGRNYSYMDFVLFDLPSFLALTHDIAEKYELKKCGFSPFKKGAEVIIFTE